MNLGGTTQPIPASLWPAWPFDQPLVSRFSWLLSVSSAASAGETAGRVPLHPQAPGCPHPSTSAHSACAPTSSIFSVPGLGWGCPWPWAPQSKEEEEVCIYPWSLCRAWMEDHGAGPWAHGKQPPQSLTPDAQTILLSHLHSPTYHCVPLCPGTTRGTAASPVPLSSSCAWYPASTFSWSYCLNSTPRFPTAPAVAPGTPWGLYFNTGQRELPTAPSLPCLAPVPPEPEEGLPSSLVQARKLGHPSASFSNPLSPSCPRVVPGWWRLWLWAGAGQRSALARPNATLSRGPAPSSWACLSASVSCP